MPLKQLLQVTIKAELLTAANFQGKRTPVPPGDYSVTISGGKHNAGTKGSVDRGFLSGTLKFFPPAITVHISKGMNTFQVSAT